MNISDTVYETLSPRQRIIATIDAIARDDAAEIDRLKATCPIKSYSQCDIAFSDVMDGLCGAGLAVEADLRGAALWCCARTDPECGLEALQDMAAIEAAWLALLAEMGITSPAAAAPPRHPMVVALLENAPEPASERVEVIYAALKASVFT